MICFGKSIGKERITHTFAVAVELEVANLLARIVGIEKLVVEGCWKIVASVESTADDAGILAVVGVGKFGLVVLAAGAEREIRIIRARAAFTECPSKLSMK